MTKPEILDMLKQMSNRELLEIIETASRIIREEIEGKTQLKAEKKHKLKVAAEAAIADYEPGGILNDLWSVSGK